MTEAQDHSRCTPEGRVLGKEIARLIQPGIDKLAAAGEPDERCKTCAFRLGTVPNGCPQTQMDALKAAMEGKPFYCHAKLPVPSVTCHGWFAARVALKGKTLAMPYPFSEPDE